MLRELRMASSCALTQAARTVAKIFGYSRFLDTRDYWILEKLFSTIFKCEARERQPMMKAHILIDHAMGRCMVLSITQGMAPPLTHGQEKFQIFEKFLEYPKISNFRVEIFGYSRFQNRPFFRPKLNQGGESENRADVFLFVKS